MRVFCPNCGVEDRQQGQFCRACGDDLRAVRGTIAHAGAPGEAVTAREEIGRAVAARIRELDDAYELKQVVEDVLPQVEKFLESPEERRLRRIRAGTVVTLIGLGALIFFLIASASKSDFLLFAGLGGVTFFIGLSLLINGIFFSRPGDGPVAERDSVRDLLDAAERTSPPEDERRRRLSPPPSVVEHTTRHLENGATSASRVRATGE